jgi:ADP-ribosyl-[dinitrogen reductase] hydrolase
MDRFVDWWRNGTYSCTGRCFDIGTTTAAALARYERTGDPLSGSTDAHAAGNGSIMRLAPVAVRHWSDRETLFRVAKLQSQTTHASEECIASSMLLAEVLADAIAGAPLPHVVAGEAALSVRGYRPGQPREDVHGTGYVVASLHAALWSVARTTSFESAVLMAANLGQDADTTAAVAGQIAGALYGLSGFPDSWLDRLAWRARITGMAEALFEAGAPDPAALRAKQGPLFPATR